MDLGLKASVALVTGGSSGLGRGCAAALASEGADVAICGRNAGRLEAARTSIDDAGAGAVLSVQADITDDQGDIDTLIEEVVSTFGHLDHLVFSTGVPRRATFLETTERDWYVTYDLLVTSAVRVVRASFPHIAAAGGGSITLIGCIDSREVVDGAVLSTAVRRAMVGLVKTLAREFAPAIRVNAVLAGPHETSGLRSTLDHGRYPSDAAMEDALRDSVPLERLGDPESFGDVVAFLASDRANFVTGTAIPVDGGMLRS